MFYYILGYRKLLIISSFLSSCYVVLSSCGAAGNSGPRRLIVEVFRSHKPGRTPPKEQSARRRVHSLHSTQQIQETNIHALSGIRTCNLRNQADADLHLTPHGYRDGLCCNFVILSFVFF